MKAHFTEYIDFKTSLFGSLLVLINQSSVKIHDRNEPQILYSNNLIAETLIIHHGN